MKSYEKKSFIQIFLSYFISVAIFVLLLGYLYFEQQRTHVIQKTAMNMHQYLLNLRSSGYKFEQKGYDYLYPQNNLDIRQMPHKSGSVYEKHFSKKMTIQVSALMVDDKIMEIKKFTIIAQIMLLILFAMISWILALRSLRPMVDAISHLDRFNKDLIHDLNTPITSILLNTKMLKKQANKDCLTKINRIENSAKGIVSLYSNLEIILNEQSLNKLKFNLSSSILKIIDSYKIIYPNIEFIYSNEDINIVSNENAVDRILDNIISNACKYSVLNNPKIVIEYKNKILSIKDNGKGIKYPKKVFERSYKESTSGHGIGMHIVYRLCENLNIKIELQSNEEKGTLVTLKF